mmetsp:Transcript_55052/g.128801  ORF Transcript_55052/g.128801 Transcript_55052/m.128801 type:complete len:195 (-) Transcript_55052:54-638(-)
MTAASIAHRSIGPDLATSLNLSVPRRGIAAKKNTSAVAHAASIVAQKVWFSEEEVISPPSAKSIGVASPRRPYRVEGRRHDSSNIGQLRRVIIGGVTVVPVTPVKPQETFCWADESATPRTLNYCSPYASQVDKGEDDAEGFADFQAWMTRLERQRPHRGCSASMQREVALGKSTMNSQLMRRRIGQDVQIRLC